MKLSSVCVVALAPFVLGSPTHEVPEDAHVRPRQLVTSNPTQDISSLITLATALNNIVTGDNINRINRIIVALDLVLNAAGAVTELTTIITVASILLAPAEVTKLVSLIDLITSVLGSSSLQGALGSLNSVSSLLTPGFINSSQIAVPAVASLLTPATVSEIQTLLPLAAGLLQSDFFKDGDGSFDQLNSLLSANFVNQSQTMVPLVHTSLMMHGICYNGLPRMQTRS